MTDDLGRDLDEIADSIPAVPSGYSSLRRLIGLLPPPTGPYIPGSSITPLADQTGEGQQQATSGSPVANTLQGDAPGTQAGWDQSLASQAIYDAFGNLAIGEGLGFGSAVIRYLLSGIPNSDFILLPREPDTNISDANPLPYWRTNQTGTAITAANRSGSYVAGTPFGPTGILPATSRVIEFTMASGGAASDEAYIEAIIGISTNLEQRYGYQLSCAFLTSGVTSNALMFINAQFLDDLGTVVGTTGESSVTTATKGVNTLFSFSHRARVGFVGIGVPTDATKLRIRIGFRRDTALTSDTDRVFLVDAVARVYPTTYPINDVDWPGDYDAGSLSQTTGLLQLMANVAGTAGGSQSKLELDGSGPTPSAAFNGSLTVNGTLDVAGLTSLAAPLALTATQPSTITGTNNDVALDPTANQFRWAGASAARINGFSGGYDGRTLVIRNTQTTPRLLTLGHEDTGSGPGNRLLCPHGQNVNLPVYGSALLIYDGTLSRWVVSVIGDGMPSGTIVLWSGQTTTIPHGWALCDGSSGTPDLRDRFVVGADTTNEGTSGGSVSPTTALATHAGHTNHGAHKHESIVINNSHGGAGQSISVISDLTFGTGASRTRDYTVSPSGASGSYPVAKTNSEDTALSHSAHDAHGTYKYFRLAYIMKL